MITLENLFALLNKVSDAIIVYDEKRNLIYFNNTSAQLFSFSPTDLNKNIYAALRHLESINFFNEILDGIKYECEINYKGEVFLIKKGDINKNLFYIIMSNITAQKNYNSFKTEIIGNLTHELKTPLALIANYAETLMLNKNIEESKRELFINKIYDAVQRLNELVTDVIYLHKLEHEKVDFVVEDPICIKDVIDELRLNYENCGKKLFFEYTKEKIFVHKVHLISVLKNLIDNAIKYSMGKNVYVMVKKEGQLKSVTVYVDDEGPIIPEAEKKRIFERFYTVSKSRKKEKSGTGLGLAIVKHISQMYKGFVSVYENKYGGNRFEVVLFEKNK